MDNSSRSPVAINAWLTGDHTTTPKKTRKSWFTVTPHKVTPQNDATTEEDLPLLKLTHFTKKVMVCFDNVRTGTSRTRELLVENPCDFPQELCLEKFPHAKGFSVPAERWELDDCESMRLPFTWTPANEGNMRELVTFKCEGAFRLQVILLGTAMDPPKRGPARRGTFSVHRKVPLRTTQPRADLKPARPTMVLKAKAQQKPKMPKASIGRVSKENRENQAPRRKSGIRKSLGRQMTPAVVDSEPCIVLSTPSPSGSPGEQSPVFTALDSSLAEINGDGMPLTAEDLLLENVKRQTLSVCRGMSPLLQAKPFAVPKPVPFKLTTEEKLNDRPVFEDPSTSPKRLSIEAKTTVTKNKAPDSEVPSKRVSLRKTLFSSAAGEEADSSCGSIGSGQEFEDSLNEPNCCVFTHHDNKSTVGSTVGKPDKELSLSVDIQTTQRLESSVGFTASCQSEPKEVHVDEPFLLNVEASLSVDELSESTLPVEEPSLPAEEPSLPAEEPSLPAEEPSLPAEELSLPVEELSLPVEEPSLSIAKPIIKGDPVFIGDNSNQLDADAFNVHTSVVTSRLLGRKRLSDPKDQAPTQVKKPRQQEVKKAEVKRQPPRERPMNRTLALRKAAASKKTGALATGGAKGQKRVGGQYRPKAPMKGVPMAKLNLLKTNGTAIPRHPMPFAAKNMFYDERWMEKQERGFTRWLNFVLTPDDCPNDPSCKATKIDAGTLCVESSSSKASIALAPSKEDLSLRAYTARRKLNRLRRGACMLFQSEPIVRVLQKLEAEIEKGRLSVRVDRKLHADYGIKQKLLELFLSYNPLWLRVGLETVYGEILPIQSNTDIVGLSRFVITRLLGNPDIAAQYAHPTVPHLFGPGYEEALSQFTLKKFLVLVFFLDRAKLTRLIDHDPCLFCKDSEFKSSRDILLHFSREYLRGEGDLTRHLSFMGYNVTHQQTALDEFDFSVTKLATDLRCGVRLARVVELLIHNWSLSSQLRVPAISRLQKIHNVEVTLKALNLEGGGVDARVIVDGHREKTLELLWRIIFKYQIGLLLNEQQLKEEITFLRKNLRLQKHLTALSRLSLSNTLMEDGRRDSNEPNVYFKSGRLSLLLKWCQVVCSFYDLKVENFTVAFSDGRALCCLVHHYHPSLLPLESIHQNTTQTQYQRHGDAQDSGDDDSFDGTWSNVYSPSTGKPGEHDELLSNERENFKLLYNRVSELGGVPGVVKSAEMSNTIPDEKVVITYVSYLCARLLDLRTEARAARTIQMVYRAYKLRQLRKYRQAQESAAKTIQQAARSFLTRRRHLRLLSTVIKLQGFRRQVLACREVQQLRQAKVELERSRAATSLQACVRGFLTRRLYQKTLKAIIIQSAVRCFIARRLYLQKRQAVITLQAAFRCQKERCNFVRMCKAAIAVQRRFRANHAGHKLRMEFILQRNACVTLQSAFRGNSCRRLYLEKRSSAIAIQTRFRAYLARDRYLQIKSATLAIQRYWRSTVYCKAVREEFLKLREATITLQSFYRGMIARQHAGYIRSVVKAQAIVRSFIQRRRYLHHKRSCTVIQACYRGYTAKKTYKTLRNSAVVLQQHFRARQEGRQQLREYNIKRGAIITLQAWRRGVLVRRQLAQQVQAAVSIQSVWKMHREQKLYLATREATLCLQKHTRAYLVGKAARKEFLKFRSTVVLIQSHCRAAFARKRYTQLRQSCIATQSYIRMYLMRKRYLAIRGAAVVMQRRFRAKLCRDHQVKVYRHQWNSIVSLQALFRGILVRKQIATKHRAAVKIQTSYKAYRDRHAYNILREATVCLQKYTRAYLIGKHTLQKYVSLKTSAVVIQSAYRGLLARRNFLNQKEAAIKIQSAVRMYQVRSNFIKLRQAAVIFQIRYRAQKEAQAEYLKYQIYRGACITIQAWVRGFLVHQEMTKLHKAATQIQKSYRSFSASTKYNRLRDAAMVLQRYWKATKLSQQVHQDYINLKEAAVVLQSAFRGRIGRHVALEHRSARVIQSYYRMHILRQLYQNQKQAAIKIQAAVRMHQAHSNYTKLRQAVVIIQIRYRAQKQAQAENQKYQIYRGACITMQAWVRGFLVRQEIAKLHKAATQIQKTYRSFCASTKYNKLRDAAMVLQRYWKATKLSQQVHQDYINLKEAAVVLQSAFRGKIGRRVALEHRSARVIQSYYRMHILRQLYQNQKQAAIKIQSLVRMQQARNKYVKLQIATVVLQRRYRATRLAVKFQMEYHIYRGACITLQACIRGFLVRQYLQKLHLAATRIQCNYKSYRAHLQFLKTKEAACVIQKYWRATRMAAVQHLKYTSLKEAAIVLQSVYRGRVARQIAREHRSARLIQSMYRMHVAVQEYAKLKAATILIQSQYRMYSARQQYLQAVKSTVAIQQFYRGYLVTKATRRDFLLTRQCVVKIQATYRGFSQRRNFATLKQAAVIVQAVYRGKQQREAFRLLKRSAVAVQEWYRSHVMRRQAMRAYFIKLGAAITIQAAFKGFTLRCRYIKMKQAVTTLQATYRAYRQRNSFISMKNAAIILQTRYRVRLLMKNACRDYHVQRHAAITIQAMYRAYTTRQCYVVIKTAATTIQAFYRGFRQRVAYQETRQATVAVQRRYRAHLLQLEATRKYHITREAVITIQAYHRGRVSRQLARQVRAARTIQKHFRGYTKRSEFHSLKKATVSVQAHVKGKREKQRYLRLKHATVILQQRYRAARDGQAVREWYLKQQSSTIRIQSAFRGFLARKSFHEIQKAVITLQAAFRGYCAHEEYKKVTLATKTLQKYFRAAAVGRQQRREFEALRHAAIIIQAQFRGHCARKLTTTLRAAVRIQSHYKMVIQRRKYVALQNAACKIRAHFKGRQVRRDYLSLKQATQVIKVRYRALKLMHSQRMKYLAIRDAVIVIQSVARGHQARKLATRNRAAVRIQSAYRGYIQERHYQMVRTSILSLQAHARGMMARREFTVRRTNWKAAVCIQNHYRGYIERRNIEAQRQVRQAQLKRFSSVVTYHLSAIRLQRCYRMYKMRQVAREKMNSILTIQMWMRAKLHRLQFLKLRRGVVSLQRCVRQHQAYRNAAAVQIQAQARVWLARQYVKKMKAAALMIQAVWRGHHVRRSTKDKKIAAVRARCIKANSLATDEKKLCNRMTSALDYLLQYRQVSSLLEALISLDIATRLSATCCVRLVEGRGVPVIFILIKNCNRSLPSMQVIKYCVNILLNLTKYSPTADSVFEAPDSINTMLDLMQMYREKGTQIFSKVCMLMGTLCQDARRAKIVLSVPKCTERLSGINRLMERKFSMDAKRALAKSKGLNTSSMSCRFLNTSALNVSGMPTPRKVRKVQPDWVLGRGKMREITDPQTSLHFVMHVLQLK